jgi:hypothetical protein
LAAGGVEKGVEKGIKERVEDDRVEVMTRGCAQVQWRVQAMAGNAT